LDRKGRSTIIPSGKLNSASDRWFTYENEMWNVGLDYYRDRIRNLNCQNGILLDIGCGPGQWSAAAAEEGFTVIGCDKKIANKAFKIRGIPHLTLLQASAETLPFRNNTFNVVLCELVLPYVNVERCINEISRVMKPTGLFHGVCHGPGYYLMQAINETKRLEGKALRRRVIVLGYTLIHRTLHLKDYFYETYQSAHEINRILSRSGMSTVFVQPGGHPVIKRKSFLGLTTFFEFLARKQ
jgi:ubiquinone/menaquinone biosynthesis C-methylase UbiE